MTVRRVVGLVSVVALAVLVAGVLRDRPPAGFHSVPVDLAGGVPGTLYYTDPPGASPDDLPTIFAPPPPGVFRAGVVVAHGFAADRHTMEALSRSLALAGYTVISLDMSGHGLNRHPFEATRPDALVRDIRAGVEFLRHDTWIDAARIVVLGHSMGAGAAMAYDTRENDVGGLVLLSGGSVQPGTKRPRNTLFLYAENDLPIIRPLVERLAPALAGKDAVEDRRTYGDMAAGTAVRTAEIMGAAHGSILAAPDAFAEVISWLDAVTGFAARDDAPALVPNTLGAPLLWIAFLVVLPGIGLLLGRLAPEPAAAPPARWADLVPLPVALFLPLAFVAADRPGILAGMSLADANVTHLALAGLVLAAALLAFGRVQVRPFGSLSALALAVAGTVVTVSLYGPVSTYFHGTGLTPEKTLLTVWTAVCLAPLALCLQWLLCRPQWWRGVLLRIAGRLVVILAVGAGLSLGAFQFSGVIAIFVLLGSLALVEPVLAGFYASSRNLVTAAAFDAIITGWLFAQYLPATF
jgi:dienelactone hydrolase